MGTVEEIELFEYAPAMRGDMIMAKTKTSAAVKNRYNLKAYDRLAITIPKGQKATIQAAADQEGESINGYVNKAVLTRLGAEDWPRVESDD